MLRRMVRNSRGFTLIELLIVVAIIGILAAIAIPNLLSAQRKAKISRALADTKQIVTQTQLYNNDFNAYPTLALLNTTGYISTTRDPFGANPATQNYGFDAGSSHIWALSVGPGAADPSVVPTAEPASSAATGAGCAGTVGWSSSYGALQPAGC